MSREIAGAPVLADARLAPSRCIAPGSSPHRPIMPCPIRRSRLAVAHLRRELGRLEDWVAATGWRWDPERSRRIDALVTRLEEGEG